MAGFQDHPEPPRNSGCLARHWNRSSCGSASISTARRDPLLNDLTSCPLFTVRHFAEHAALSCCLLSFTFSAFRMARCLHRSVASVSNERRTTMMHTAALEIVWRNPKPPQRQQRWEQVTRDSTTGHYLLQELISTPVGSFWATTSSLEILRGGRAA